jgi:hypothetical protein
MSKKTKSNNHQPKVKGLYAWNYLHAGSFLLYVETLKDCHKFLFLPGPSEYFLTFEDFSSCVQKNTLEFVEELPDDVFEESLKISLQRPLNASKIIWNENSQIETKRTAPKETSNA